MTVPPYLNLPSPEARTYGKLQAVIDVEGRVKEFQVYGEPQMLEFAKRMFPGSGARHGYGIRFAPTRRLFGDLVWLMQRYPLEVKCPQHFREAWEASVAHAQVRESGADLSPVVPPVSFLGTLLEYQAVAVAYLLHNQRTLLADDMGLGKTVSALAALATAGAFPALVVAPTAVQRQWAQQAGAFLRVESGDLFAQAAVLKGKTPYEIPNLPIIVIHYGLLASWQDALVSHGFKAVIFDEIQELRHTGTAKYSAASVLSGAVDLAWGLSGTPIYNYGSEIWAVMNVLDFQCLGGWESFSREWCTGYGDKVVAKPDVLGAHLRDLGLILRRRKSEVLSELPEKRRVRMDIMHDEGEYARLLRDAVKLARSFDALKWEERGQATREIEEKARHAAGVAKAPWVALFVDSLIEAGERPLVFAWHHDVHDALLSGLKERQVAEITGRVNERQKREALERFKAGDADAVLLSLRSTAGLDGLQGRATCVVFAELDWSPAVHAQCEDRVHRMGFVQESGLLCYYLVSNTGFDLIVQEVLGLKLEQFFELFGEREETEAERDAAATAAQKHLGTLVARVRKGG